MTDVVAKLWGFCNYLRHDGMNYGLYIEQLTYLLFLKMAFEKGRKLPKGCNWNELLDYSGSELLEEYLDLLKKLSKEKGLLGDIFAKSNSHCFIIDDIILELIFAKKKQLGMSISK